MVISNIDSTRYRVLPDVRRKCYFLITTTHACLSAFVAGFLLALFFQAQRRLRQSLRLCVGRGVHIFRSFGGVVWESPALGAQNARLHFHVRAPHLSGAAPHVHSQQPEQQRHARAQWLWRGVVHLQQVSCVVPFGEQQVATGFTCRLWN